MEDFDDVNQINLIKVSAKKKKPSLNKNGIEQAASILQNMLIDSEFVKFTKNTNLDINNGKNFNMEISEKELSRKLDNKEKIDLKDLKKLKKIYYGPEDQDLEDFLKEDNKNHKLKFSVNDIIYGIVLFRREELMKQVENINNDDLIKKEIMENVEEINSYIEVTNDNQKNTDNSNMDIEPKINNIVQEEEIHTLCDKVRSKSKALRKEFNNVKAKEKALFEFIEEKDKILSKKKEKNLKDLRTFSDNNPNRIIEKDNNNNKDERKKVFTKEELFNKINNIKKNKAEEEKNFFKNSTETKFMLANEIANSVANLAKNDYTNKGYWVNTIRNIENNNELKNKIPINEQNMKSMFGKICQDMKGYSDITGPLKELLNITYENANAKDYAGTDLYKINMLNVIVAMANRISELTNVINNLWQYQLNDYKIEKEVFKLGKKGRELNKNALISKEKNCAMMRKIENYIPNKDWAKLPLAKRIRCRFKFSDYNQLPNALIWKKFTIDEKFDFMKDLINYRLLRSEQLLKEFKEKDPLDVIGKINAFLYYNGKDSKGYKCFIENEVWEKVNKLFLENNNSYEFHQKRIEKLTTILKDMSDQNGVIGIYYFKGKKIKCNGKSFEDTIIGSVKNKNFYFNKPISYSSYVKNKRYYGYNNKNKDNNNASTTINNKLNKFKKNKYKKNNNRKIRKTNKKKYEELVKKLETGSKENILKEIKENEKMEKSYQIPNF